MTPAWAGGPGHGPIDPLPVPPGAAYSAGMPTPHEPAQEFEVKLQVPPQARAAVHAALGTRGLRSQALQAHYVDTPTARLAKAGIALRLRREGRQWVQTVKCGLAHGLARLEHNVVVPAAAARNAQGVPLPDPTRHAGSEAGRRLQAALGDGAGELAVQHGTQVRRLLRTLWPRGAKLELALDTGWLLAAGRRQALCELEIELKLGEPVAVLHAARGWVRQHGLWLQVRSKAERAALLARGLPMAAAVKAQEPRLVPGQPVHAAWALVLHAALAHALPNAAQVASGAFADEHVHQLRVALRRLRSALRLFRGLVPELPATVEPALRDLFSALGSQRDLDVLAAELLPQMAAAGISAPLPARRPAATRHTAAAARAEAANLAWLDLHAAALRPGAGPGDTALLLRRLSRWHERAAQAAQGFAEAEDEARHDLRKRLKRLRYGLAFCAGLLPAAAVARQHRALAKVQGALGRFNDLCTAQALLARRGAAAAPALAWLQAERTQVLRQAARALARWRRLPWPGA